jgi:hypothetical protein
VEARVVFLEGTRLLSLKQLVVKIEEEERKKKKKKKLLKGVESN